MTPQRMKIENKPIDALTPYGRNSRMHSPEQIDKLAASISEFGFTNPVLIDSSNGIIAGHGRVMAARKIGLESVPCIRLSHLTDPQRRAYIIADNQLAMGSGWDWDALRLELADLEGDGFALDLLGFDAADLDGFMGCDDDFKPEHEAEADASPDPKPPIECPHCRKFFVP